VTGRERGHRRRDRCCANRSFNFRFAQLIRDHSRLIPIEIKSAATFSPDFLKGLDRFPAIGLNGLGLNKECGMIRPGASEGKYLISYIFHLIRGDMLKWIVEIS